MLGASRKYLDYLDWKSFTSKDWVCGVFSIKFLSTFSNIHIHTIYHCDNMITTDQKCKVQSLEVDDGQRLAYFWNNNNQKKEKKNVQFYKSLTSCIERVGGFWLKWLTQYREIGGAMFTGKLESDLSHQLLSHILKFNLLEVTFQSLFFF